LQSYFPSQNTTTKKITNFEMKRKEENKLTTPENCPKIGVHYKFVDYLFFSALLTIVV